MIIVTRMNPMIMMMMIVHQGAGDMGPDHIADIGLDPTIGLGLMAIITIIELRHHRIQRLRGGSSSKKETKN